MTPIDGDNLTAIAIAIISGIFMWGNTLLTVVFSKRKTKPTKEVYIKNAVVSEQGRYLRHQYFATHVLVPFYHNGQDFYTGEHKDLFTLRYEFLATGKKSYTPHMKDLTAGYLEDLPSLMEDSGIIFDNKVKGKLEKLKEKNIPSNPCYYSILREFVVDSAVHLAIYKRVFLFKNLLYLKRPWENRMVASIHIFWENSEVFNKLFQNSPFTQSQFLTDLDKLANLCVSKRVQITDFHSIAAKGLKACLSDNDN